MTIVITLPDEISDETAAHIVDLCYQLGHVLEGHYYGQIRRYCQRECPPPFDDGNRCRSSRSWISRSKRPYAVNVKPVGLTPCGLYIFGDFCY